MNHVDFIDRSNANKRVCKNHLFSFWGEGFDHCVQGKRLNQPCEELEEKYIAKEGLSER